jgi:hypothetical protein
LTIQRGLQLTEFFGRTSGSVVKKVHHQHSKQVNIDFDGRLLAVTSRPLINIDFNECVKSVCTGRGSRPVLNIASQA